MRTHNAIRSPSFDIVTRDDSLLDPELPCDRRVLGKITPLAHFAIDLCTSRRQRCQDYKLLDKPLHSEPGDKRLAHSDLIESFQVHAISNKLEVSLSVCIAMDDTAYCLKWIEIRLTRQSTRIFFSKENDHSSPTLDSGTPK